MNEKMKNLLVRTLSGAVLATVMLGAILLSRGTFGLLLFVVLAGGMYETYRLGARCGAAPQYFLGILAGVMLFLANFMYAAGFQFRFVYAAGAFFVLLLFSLFVAELLRGKSHPVLNLGVTLLGVIYVALPVSLLNHLPTVESWWKPWIMVFYLLIIWANDVFAYLVGMTWGRHRLCERLSPKKTWEGFFGGIAGAVLMGVVASYALQSDVWRWIGLALVASITGVAGDLTESMFKRAAGVKDSGTVIPGHGGFLDRFDALLLSAPFVLVYLLAVEGAN